MVTDPDAAQGGQSAGSGPTRPVPEAASPAPEQLPPAHAARSRAARLRSSTARQRSSAASCRSANASCRPKRPPDDRLPAGARSWRSPDRSPPAPSRPGDAGSSGRGRWLAAWPRTSASSSSRSARASRSSPTWSSSRVGSSPGPLTVPPGAITYLHSVTRRSAPHHTVVIQRAATVSARACQARPASSGPTGCTCTWAPGGTTRREARPVDPSPIVSRLPTSRTRRPTSATANRCPGRTGRGSRRHRRRARPAGRGRNRPPSSATRPLSSVTGPPTCAIVRPRAAADRHARPTDAGQVAGYEQPSSTGRSRPRTGSWRPRIGPWRPRTGPRR
jgi:hypothetical protein